ncbi:hypothetical protein Dimus_032355 [Dionaea muscipula]
MQPQPLLGPLENIPVVQIAAGYCYLLALAFQPSGMSVYSVGCGLGGKLGHGSKTDEKYPRRIEQLTALNLNPTVIAAGAWHAAVVGKDGRVCTWGWGRNGYVYTHTSWDQNGLNRLIFRPQLTTIFGP